MTHKTKNILSADPEKDHEDILKPSAKRWRAAQLRSAGLLGSLLIAVSLSGCMTGPRQWICNHFKVGPNYVEPAAPVASQWLDHDNPKIKQQATDYSYWWATFNDPMLNDLVRNAYEQNLTLKMAGARILEARAQLGMAQGNLFPQQQQADGAYSRTQMSSNSYPFGAFPLPKMAYDNWTVGFDAAWELDFWGRYRRAVESADANLSVQLENYDNGLVILQAEVAATYIQLRTLENRLALAQKNVDLQRKTLRITRDRFEAGLVSQLDVKQAESILGGTESLLPTFEAGRRKAKNRLCILLGMPPSAIETTLGQSGRIPHASPTVAVGIPAELLTRRPDVRRAERKAAAQCEQIGIAESELYPHISITGMIAFDTEYLNQLIASNSIAGSVGPRFRWNILNYGRLRNNIRVQDARFQQLVLDYQQTVLRANEEVENAITSFLHEQIRVKYLEASTKATAEAVELANLQYDQGLVDFQRVLDSERALVVQQDALAESQGGVATNLVAIYKALGGGWRMRCGPYRLPEVTPQEILPEEIPKPVEPTAMTVEPLPPISTVSSIEILENP